MEQPIVIGSLAVPFWDYLIGFKNINHKKELLRSLWVVSGLTKGSLSGFPACSHGFLPSLTRLRSVRFYEGLWSFVGVRIGSGQEGFIPTYCYRLPSLPKFCPEEMLFWRGRAIPKGSYVLLWGILQYRNLTFYYIGTLDPLGLFMAGAALHVRVPRLRS